MKNTRFKLVLLVLFLLFSNIIISQNTDSANQNLKIKDSTHASLSINYISDAVFMGRKDTISAPYLYPSIMYHHKSGFYANGSFSYLTKSNESRIDLFLVTAGFDFSIKKLDGDISVTKYFFNDDSYNVISEVEADLTATLKYDFNIFNLGITANTYFNNNSSSDFFLSSEISHDFISKNEKLQASPTVGIYFGSQNFYEEYYINQVTNNGAGQGQGSGGTTQTINNVTIVESEAFNLMAIEISLPIWFEQKPFTVMFLPTYVLPQNKAKLVVDDIVFEEDLDETFYWVLGLGYRF